MLLLKTLLKQRTSYKKQITKVVKLYTKKQKYNSFNSSFNYKLTILINIYKRVKLLQNAYIQAFFTILKELALSYFYNNQLFKRSFNDVCTNIQSFFEDLIYYRHNLDLQNNTSLALTAAKNSCKTTYKNVQLLINNLRQLQYKLLLSFKTVEFFYNKVITAY